MEKFSSKVIKSFELRQGKLFKEFQSTQEVLFNLIGQMDDIFNILSSISNDLQNLNQRQLQLENSFRESKNLLHTPPQSFKRMKDEDNAGELEEILSIELSPIGKRTRNKTRKTAKTGNNQRYIIPWEEISYEEL